MANRKISDVDADTTFKFEKVGQKFKGYYLGNKIVTSDFGPSKLHVFETPKGRVGIFGSAKLDSMLAQITPGEMTTIVFEGKVNLPGGKTMKRFAVWADDSDTSDVELPKVNFKANSNDADELEEEEELEATTDAEDDYPEETEEEQEEEDETDRNPVQSRPAGNARPAQKSDVAALLSKSKRKA